MCCCFSFFPHQPVSPNHFHMPQWCGQYRLFFVMTAMFSLLFTTGNTWNITESEWCIPTSCNDIVMCLWLLYVLLFSPSSHLRGWVPLFSTFPNDVCAVSVILANNCHVFSPLHYWEYLEHNSSWVMYPYIFYWHSDVVVLLCVAVSPSHLSRWVPSFPHGPMMCAVSVTLTNDCHVFSPLHFWEYVEHNRAWVMHPYIF